MEDLRRQVEHFAGMGDDATREVYLAVAQWREVIAALEERDRLRAAAQPLAYPAETDALRRSDHDDPRILGWIIKPELVEVLRAVLEGRDG